LPFESDSLGGIMCAVIQDDPRMLSTFRPDVPHAFEAIVRRCLTRDRRDRAQNVGEIAMTLSAYAPARTRPIADRIASLLGTRSLTSTMAAVREPLPAAGGPITDSGAVTGAGPITGSGPVLGAGPITGAPAVTTAAPPRPRRAGGAGVLAGAIVAGIVLGSGAYFWSRSASRPVPPSTASSQ